jgi:hypothetical protein
MTNKVSNMNSSSKWKAQEKSCKNYFDFKKKEDRVEEKEKENHFLLFCSSTR